MNENPPPRRLAPPPPLKPQHLRPLSFKISKKSRRDKLIPAGGGDGGGEEKDKEPAPAHESGTLADLLAPDDKEEAIAMAMAPAHESGTLADLLAPDDKEEEEEKKEEEAGGDVEAQRSEILNVDGEKAHTKEGRRERRWGKRKKMALASIAALACVIPFIVGAAGGNSIKSWAPVIKADDQKIIKEEAGLLKVCNKLEKLNTLKDKDSRPHKDCTEIYPALFFNTDPRMENIENYHVPFVVIETALVCAAIYLHFSTAMVK